MKGLGRFSCVLVIVLLAAVSARAQLGPNWKYAGKLPFFPSVVYFADIKHGIAGTSTRVSGPLNSIYYTSDGLTWQKSNSSLTDLESIREINRKLYAAVLNGPALVSSDSGVTWNTAGAINGAPDLFLDSSGRLSTLPSPFLDGRTQGTFARADRLHCVFTRDDNGRAQYSSDGGATWSPIVFLPGNLTRGGFGAYGDTCNHVMMYCDETDTLIRSTDLGLTWKKLLNLSEDLIEGAAGIVYTHGSAGVYRSTDYGTNWQLVGGPTSRGEDYHFAVFGNLGQNVAVQQFDSTVWMTTNGGDGAMLDPLATDTLRLTSGCDGKLIPIALRAFRGQTSFTVRPIEDSVHDFEILGSDSLYFAAAGGGTIFLGFSPKLGPGTRTVTLREHVTVQCNEESATRVVIVTVPPKAKIATTSLTGSCTPVQANCTAHLDPCQSIVITAADILPASFSRLRYVRTLPDTIADSTKTLIPLEFDPRDTILNSSVKLHLSGYYLGTTVPFDTTIVIKLTAAHIASQLLSAVDSIARPAVDFCGSFDTVITYRNSGCDTITVSEQREPIPADWTVTGPQLPLRLPADSGFVVHLHCSPTKLGASEVALTYKFDQPVIGSLLTARFYAATNVVYNDVPLAITTDTIHLGTRSFCDGDTTIVLPFSNPGCDSAEYTIALQGSEYALTSTTDTVLSGDRTGAIGVHFGSHVKGDHPATITIHARDKRIPTLIRDTTIHFTAHVGDGTRTLEADLATIDFGATYICEDRDSSITITNTGCDTVTLSQTDIQGSGFIFSADLSFPIVIAPGEKKSFPIHTVIDTSGHPTTKSGSIQFTSNARPELTPITLSRAFHYPGKFGIALSVRPTTQVDKTVNVELRRTGSIPPEASSISFTVTCNEDVLSYLSVAESDIHAGASTILPDGRTERHFTMAPASDRDVLATLAYHSYLTTADSTGLSVSGPLVHINDPSIPSDCIAAIDTSAYGASILLQCGQNTLQGFLRTNSLDFTIARVETTEDKLSFEQSPRHSDIRYAIYDLLGRKMLEGSAGGSQEIDITSISQGAYLLRVSTGNYSASRRFVVVR